QDLLLDRRALALEVAAGDPPSGVRALAILHGQGKEVLGLASALGGDAGREDHGAAELDHHRAVGLLGDLAGLDGEGSAVDVEGYGRGTHSHRNTCPRVSARWGPPERVWRDGD